MAGIAAYGQSFNADAALAEWKQGFDERKKRAAQHLLAALLARMRAKTGEMRRKTSVKLTSTGFLLLVELFYSYFVDQGHKVGSRRTARAKVLRNTAKLLRQERKLTGDTSREAEEKALRSEATKLNKLQKAGRQTVPGLEFIKKTLDAERATVIAILAGEQ